MLSDKEEDFALQATSKKSKKQMQNKDFTTVVSRLW
jgi:hypothetical protein